MFSAILRLTKTMVALDRTRRDKIRADRRVRQTVDEHRRQQELRLDDARAEAQTCGECCGSGVCSGCAGRPTCWSSDGRQEVCGSCGASGRCPACGGTGLSR